MTDTENVFEALDLPYHAKAVEIWNKHKLISENYQTHELIKAFLSDFASALKAEREEERERCAKLLIRRAEHHRTELDIVVGKTAKTVRDMLQAELFELAAAIRNRST
jgi:hemerythrin